MTATRKIVSGTLWSFAQNSAARLISFAVFAVLGRLLSPEAFGVVALAQASIDVLLLFVGQGIAAFLVHKEALEDEHIDTAFWTTVGTSVALAAGLTLVAPFVATFTDAPEVTPIIRWLAWTMPLHGLSQVHVALLTRGFEFRLMAVRTMLAAIVGGVAGVAAAFAGWGTNALVAQIVISQVTSTAALWWASGWRPSLRWSRSHALEQLRYSGGVTGAGILRVLSTRLDSFLIAGVLGTGPLGVYAVARRILQLCSNLLSKSGDAVAASAFARQQHDLEALGRSARGAVSFSIFAAAPSFVGLAVLADVVVPLLLGHQWDDAVPVLRVLCGAGIVMAAGYVLSAAARAVGRPIILTYAQLAVLILYLGLLYLLFPLGLPGVAAAFTLAIAVVLPFQLWLLQRMSGVSTAGWLRVMAPILAVSLVMGGAMWGARALLAPSLASIPAARAIEAGVAALVGVSVFALLARALLPEQIAQVRSVIAAVRGRGRAGAQADG